MSTIKSTSGIQYTGMTQNVAAGQLESTDSATGKSATKLFADPAVTPLAAPLVDQSTHSDAKTVGAEPATDTSTPLMNEDQNLRHITQAIALRSDSVSAHAFTCGSYTRPNSQLETVFKSIFASLTANQPDFYHHG